MQNIKQRIYNSSFNLFYGFVKYLPWGFGRFLRFCVLKVYLKRIDSFYICEGLTVVIPEYISIGRNTTINEWVQLIGEGGIEIGDWVDIAHGVSIISSDHGFSSLTERIRLQKHVLGRVVIEDEVWIGCGAKILKGVTIGKGSLIGAGSVVTKSIPPYSVAVGNPCRVIKKRNAEGK